jgi:hypothetical protein
MCSKMLCILDVSVVVSEASGIISKCFENYSLHVVGVVVVGFTLYIVGECWQHMRLRAIKEFNCSYYDSLLEINWVFNHQRFTISD